MPDFASFGMQRDRPDSTCQMAYGKSELLKLLERVLSRLHSTGS